MDYTKILFDRDGGVATITLNRPEAMNALSPDLVDELTKALAECEFNREIRVVVITGNGRAFCAGADVNVLDEKASQSGPSPSHFMTADSAHQRVVIPLRRMAKPVIAAVNGAAAGAGLGLAMACDLRIAAAEARFRLAYAGMAFCPDAGTSYTLPRLVGMAKAIELYLYNEVIPADQALSLGLVNRVVPGTELLQEVRQLAHRLAAGPTFAFGQTKLLFNSSWRNDFASQLSEEARSLGLCAGTADHAAAVAAFLAKQQPQFTGQ